MGYVMEVGLVGVMDDRWGGRWCTIDKVISKLLA